jgi:hypothetical protein
MDGALMFHEQRMLFSPVVNIDDIMRASAAFFQHRKTCTDPLCLQGVHRVPIDCPEPVSSLWFWVD